LGDRGAVAALAQARPSRLGACGRQRRHGQCAHGVGLSRALATGTDFLKASLPSDQIQAIVTNPPYGIGQAFIEHALALTKPVGGVVAMLLRCDYDHAKTRQHLFGKCPAFAKKLILTKRIVWFDDLKAAPSFNHAWFLFDWQHKGAPTVAYGP
jgi:hypothetical protein